MPRPKNKSETLVVDASVAVKWFLPEAGAEPAVALLRAGHRLIAPDLLWIEVASVLWKVVRRGALTADEAERMVSDAAAFPVEMFESGTLLTDTRRIATATAGTVYDSLYVALAAREDAVMVTADERLVNALANTGWADAVQRLTDA